MRPGVARDYLREVTRDFEAYAEREYLPMLEAHEPDPDLLLAGLRYIATRRVPDRVADLYEVLTTTRPLRVKKRIDEACLDAIVATTDDRLDAARFLTAVCTASGRVPSLARYEDALRQLGSASNLALLDALAVPELSAVRGRRLARMLLKVSDVKPPEPVGTWLRGDAARRLDVVERWRGLVADAGGLPTPESDEVAEPDWPDSPDPWADSEPTDGD